VNKAELIDALAARLGDKRAATQALDAVLTEVQNAVTKGDKVAITGFGVFEKKVRAARTARNPRTGEAVKVKKTSVPAFRPGAGFRELVASGKVPKVAAAKKTTATKTATKAASTRTATKTAAKTATKTAATKTTAAKTTAAKKTTATKAAPARKTAAKATKAASTPAARKTTTAKATTAKSTTAKKAPARKR
jgi:DNA-binding protein HU-beta